MGDESNILTISPRKIELYDKLHSIAFYDNKPRTINQIKREVFGDNTAGNIQKLVNELIQLGIIYFHKKEISKETHREEDFYKINKKKFWKMFCEIPSIKLIAGMIDREGIIFMEFGSTTIDFIRKVFTKKKEIEKMNQEQQEEEKPLTLE